MNRKLFELATTGQWNEIIKNVLQLRNEVWNFLLVLFLHVHIFGY